MKKENESSLYTLLIVLLLLAIMIFGDNLF